jgi:hypothetical protein
LFSSFSRFLLHTPPTHQYVTPCRHCSPSQFTLASRLAGVPPNWARPPCGASSPWARPTPCHIALELDLEPRRRACVVLNHRVISTTTLTVLASPPPLWTGHPCVRRSRFFLSAQMREIRNIEPTLERIFSLGDKLNL